MVAISRTRFADLGRKGAAAVDRRVFPTQIGRTAGGPPVLPKGQRIARLLSTHAAQIALPHGRRAVVESLQPMAVENARGHLEPVDLSLRRLHGGFGSVRPIVGVVIPGRAEEGIALPDPGVSLTPVNSRGVPLGGAEGTIDGASVVYANTQTNADTVVKPTLDGAELSTVLRSADSPTQLYYRVGTPGGASLVQSHSGIGPVRVVDGAHTIAVIRPPGALDARGADVPVSMKSEGKTLDVSVLTQGGNYQSPIEVDPELALARDEAFGPEQCHQQGEGERQSSNWCWHPSSTRFRATWYTGDDPAVDMWNEGSASAGEYGAMSYLTQGESKIYEAGAYTDGYLTGGVAKLEFARERSTEAGEVETGGEDVLPVENNYKTFSYNHFCANTKTEASECSTSAGSPHNLVAVKAEAKQPLSEIYDIDFGVQNTQVYISQEKKPEASVNEGAAELEVEKGVKRENVAYTKGWMSPEQGAFEYIVHDPGVGVSEAGIQEMGGGNIHIQEKIYEAGKCNGVQCNETYHSAVTYSPEMADGEDKFEVWGRDEAGLFGYIGFYSGEGPVIKVDGTKPHNLGFTGMAEEDAEIRAAPHTLTVHATDGTEPTPSSGMKSIVISIDGSTEDTVSGASCPKGPCTATGTYTLHAEDLTEGVHRLVVTATDNAGNVAAREFVFDVRHSTPVAVGPGTVDPTTGQFKLTRTDVSLAGAGGVSRDYQSRDLSAGAGGPLGSQWALSLGGGQGMTQLPGGSVVLSSSSGGTTTFYLNEEGEYESPLGDENITVEAKEEEGVGISEYLLKDAKADTTTVFTQPAGTGETVPVYANQFGQQGAALGKAVSDAVDARGNVWVTDHTNDRILEFSSAGVLLHAYGSEGEWPNQFRDPRGIAIDKATGDVYVADAGNSRIVELNSSGSFVRAFGWGVKPGQERKDEFQECTSYCQAGMAGGGKGEIEGALGVTIDSSGDVWVSEEGTIGLLIRRKVARIQEFSATGEYLHSYGAEGAGDEQFSRPESIAASGNDLYIADAGNNRIQELTTGGAFVKMIGWGVADGQAKLEVCTNTCRAGIAGSSDGEFNAPAGVAIDPTGDIYVSDTGNDRVQELTTEGAFLAKFGEAGSGNGQLSEPAGVALGAAGEIYVADYGNKRVQEWTRPTWLPARTEGALKNVATAYAYEAVQLDGETVVEPTEALAATPDDIECVGPEKQVEPQYLKDGCRALTFNYAKSTTATGEAPNEWGDYVGQLTRVYFHGYDPPSEAGSTDAMKTVTVAHYLYDSKGRLRAEWDPRTEPDAESDPEAEECEKDPLEKGCLATVYGYDEEGHVTSVTPPGQESWALTYGTIPRDPSPGRLLKTRRAPASAKLWDGEPLSEIDAPKLSGTAVVGVRMGVTDGKWEGEPVSYGYQWEDCGSSGCSPIPGATNPNYVPQADDVGHELEAKVTATNGGGSMTVATGASGAVASSWAEHSASHTEAVDGAAGIEAVSCMPNSSECVLSDSKGNAFSASDVSATERASWQGWNGPGASPSEAVDCPSSGLCLLAAGTKSGDGGVLYYATSLGGAWTQAYSPAYGVDAISCVSASFCVDGQDGDGYFRYSTSPASSSWSLEEQGAAAMRGVSCVSTSFCAMVGSGGSLYVATTSTQVESSSWSETDIDGTTMLDGIACTSIKSCVAVDSAGNALELTISSTGAATVAKQDIDESNKLSAVSCAGATCVAVDDVGEVFVSPDGGQTWKKQFTPGGDLTSVSCASASLCVTGSTTGEVTSLDPAQTQAIDSPKSLNAISCVPESTTCVVSDANGNAYYATDVSAESSATWHAWSGPEALQSQAVACPSSSLCLIANGTTKGAIHYAKALDGSWTDAFSGGQAPVVGISCPSAAFCVGAESGNATIRYSTNPESTSWTAEKIGGATLISDVACLSSSFCVLTETTGVQVATTESQVESTSWPVSNVDNQGPEAVACTSRSSCVAVDQRGNALKLAITANGTATASKQDIDGTAVFTAVTCTGSATCVAVDREGNVFVTPNAGESWTKAYHLGGDLTGVSCASSALCATVDTSGRVTAFDPESVSPGSSYTQDVDGGGSLNAVSCVPGSTDCVISDGNGNAFYATNVSTTSTPSWAEWSGPGVSPSEAVSCPRGGGNPLCLMAAGERSGDGGALYYGTSFGGSWTQAASPSYGVDAISCPSASFCVEGQDGGGYFGYSTSPASSSWTLEDQGSAAMKGVSCLSASFCAIADGNGSVHVATSESAVESSSWMETNVDGSTTLNGIACTSSSECLAVDGEGELLELSIAVSGTATVIAKHELGGTSSLNAVACSGETCAAVDSEGKVFTSVDGGTWAQQYAPGGDLTAVSCASASLCVTVSRGGEATAFNPSGETSEASERAPQQGTTIEYEVPVSGEGAPANLSKTELEKWGQQDDPTEATAIFPPDEPQGWPAGGYEKATVDYMDEEGRTVNTKAPSGGIATTEYNEANEVVRNLSPDNRATALAAGAKSAEVAERLSTSTEYDEPFDDEIVRTLGPEHEIKLPNGEEVQARAVTHDYYDEGAEEAEEANEEEYNLLTKSVSGALLADGEEKDKRTTITSYSGQNDLGWKLRKPTSTTIDPEGLDLTSSTVYDGTTGEVIETRAPGGAAGKYSHSAEYLSQWGTADAEEHVSKPYGVAVGPEGDVWVADSGDSRIVKLNSAGEFIASYGSEGSGDGQFNDPGAIAVDAKGDVWVADSNNDRVQELSSEGTFIREFGSEGSGDGQLKHPHGISISSDGNVWVSDGGNDRLQEFSPTGEFIRAVGSEGKNDGEFNNPYGLTIDSNGNIWVADLFNNRVEEFSSDGAYIAQFAVTYPTAVVTDGRNLLVAAGDGSRVSEFSHSGGELASVGASGEGEGHYEAAYGVAVDSNGAVWIADAGENGGVMKFSVSAAALGYISKFGQEGTAEGQFKDPMGMAIDDAGDVWVSDTGNDRVQELSPTGTSVLQFGSEGEGEGQFNSPTGVAIDKEGDIWVADTGNERLQEFSPTGSYITRFKTASTPSGVAVDLEGDLWVSERGSDNVSEYSSSGEELERFGGEGTGAGKFDVPAGIAVDKEGHVWVADEGNNRIQEFSVSGEPLRQIAVEDPRGLRIDSHGDLWVARASGVQELSSSGEVLESFGTEGTANGQFEQPWGVALDAEGDVWVADSGNDRVQELGSVVSYAYAQRVAGLSPMQFADPKGIAVAESGEVWVADTANHRIQEVSAGGEFIRQANRSLVRPEGIAVDGAGNVWVTDAAKDEVSEFSSTGSFKLSFGSAGAGEGQLDEPGGIAVSGEDEYVVDRGNDRVQEFDAEGKYMRQFGEPGSGKGQLSEPQGIGVDARGDIWVADTGNDRVQEFSAEGAYIAAYGTAGSGEGQLSKPEGISIDTEGDIWIADTGNNRVQELSPNGTYMQQLASEGAGAEEVDHPAALAIDASNQVYVLDTGNDRVQKWQSMSVLHEKEGASTHATKTIYYTPGSEAEAAACQDHPEWASLPCRTEPIAQPADVQEGKPAVPVSTMAYNIWDEVETTTETFGTVTRTEAQTYDTAGRAITSQETSTSGDKPLPIVTNQYNAATGALETQSETLEGKVKQTTARENTLGQMVEYRDASGNVAHYVYEEGGDGRLLEVSEGDGEEAESKQTYSYDETTGLMSKLVDSAAGTFTASYDLEGRMASEIYPNGMCANTSYDTVGVASSISYIKTRDCSEEKPTVWFSDSIVPGIYGETLSQTSTLAKESYAYDEAGRLTETQERPSGKGCTARLYAYDEAGNRLSQTTRKPTPEGNCATEGGSTERHTYDEADRLTDEGVQYETLGNITTMPASDAGGRPLTSSYYLDGQVATQEQNEVKDSYLYDPAGRTMQTSSENTTTEAFTTAISHYAGPGEAVSWTSEGEGKWSRNIPGLGGGLQATETADKVVTLQLRDLQGNIVATASDYESETKLLSTYNSTEFGVPNEGKTPPKYAWLGAAGHTTEPAFETGVSVQGGAAYVPQVARDLQTAAVEPPGAFPDGQGTGEQYDSEIPGWYLSLSAEESAATLAAWTAEQKAKQEEAERASEWFDPEDPDFWDYDDPVHLFVTAQILSKSAEVALVEFTALANVPGVGHKHIQMLRVNMKRVTEDGRVVLEYSQENEYKQSIPKMYYTVNLTREERWGIELVAVVWKKLYKLTILLQVVGGDIAIIPAGEA